ncbi:CLUMA_CG007135, isoform A [Clunio marinus]|uniref:CLUMA_CG007135, isoform A n=1 Tax=Clunio marinus TaxID=568069 RepID=A0A1J1I1G7_9DIPT|nr:CLUMA_CG007135, isoform A [Clunio marinus]
MNSNSTKYCCRTCLEQKNDLMSLYSVDVTSGMQICDMILQTSQVQVFNKVNAPSSICGDCRYKLNIAFQFQQQCKNSDQKLQEFLRTSIPDQGEPNVDERDIQAAVQEFFGNEGDEQDINYQPLVLNNDIDTNIKSTDYLNIDRACLDLNSGNLLKKVVKKVKAKTKPIKDKLQLDELLKTHKEKMKSENASKIQIFKQKRRKKVADLAQPEQCFQCGKIFHYKGYMELHLRTHSNYKAYECNTCHKKFTQISNLNLHLRTHTKEKPFACERCPKLFSTSSNLKVHLKIHTGIKDHSCGLCSKAFKTASELKSHEGTHSQVKSKICKICGKSFYKTAYLNVHIKNVHYGLKKYKCDNFNCNKVFSNSSNLIAHRRIHTGEKPYICKREGCNAKFNQSSSRARHMKSHNKNSKFKMSPDKVKDKEQMKPAKKCSYIIPELLKENSPTEAQVCISEQNRSPQSTSNCLQQQDPLQNSTNTSYSVTQQSLLPEALNPMNLINNTTSTPTFNAISTHSASSLLLSLPTHHDPPQLSDHSIHHFSNFETTTYLPATSNILPPNSFNFIMSGLDFSKNSLNGEPTYIDY